MGIAEKDITADLPDFDGSVRNSEAFSLHAKLSEAAAVIQSSA